MKAYRVACLLCAVQVGIYIVACGAFTSPSLNGVRGGNPNLVVSDSPNPLHCYKACKVQDADCEGCQVQLTSSSVTGGGTEKLKMVTSDCQNAVKGYCDPPDCIETKNLQYTCTNFNVTTKQ